MVLSFKKVEKKEETDNTVVKDSNFNYKELYDKLFNKYNDKVKELENKNMNLRKENEELAKKLNNIKNLFN
jgi:predicted RNase H-like nuclease (RuvC/YqgF family)